MSKFAFQVYLSKLLTLIIIIININLIFHFIKGDFYEGSWFG